MLGFSLKLRLQTLHQGNMFLGNMLLWCKRGFSLTVFTAAMSSSSSSRSPNWPLRRSVTPDPGNLSSPYWVDSGMALASSWTRLSQVRRRRPAEVESNLPMVSCLRGYSLSLVTLYCRQLLRLKPSTAKTVASSFYLQNVSSNRKLQVCLDGQRLMHDSHPNWKYLVVTLDCALSFREHQQQLPAK